MASDISVHEGFWKNWDRQRVDSGWTLTLSQDRGVLLVAFFTLLVAIASNHLWGILCFVLHQCRSTPTKKNGLYHQQQAFLANSPTGSRAAVTLLSLAWAWRGHHNAHGGGLRSAFLPALAFIYVILVAAASLLASRVVLGDDLVIVQADQCGWMATELAPDEGGGNFTGDVQLFLASNALGLWTAREALEYARKCYGQDTPGTDARFCGSYAVPSIPILSAGDVDCPFADEICATPKAFEVDTGLIDSNAHLGINLEPRSRISFRKVLTCAPILAEEKFSSDWITENTDCVNPGAALPGNMYKYYNLGPDVPVSNATMCITKYTHDHPAPGYSIGFITQSEKFPQDSGWKPITQLQVSNGDLTGVFLENKVRYPVPVEDPWFQATAPSNFTLTGSDISFFESNRALSFLACTERFQFCNAHTSKCTRLSGAPLSTKDIFAELEPLDDDQRTALQIVQTAATGASIANGVAYLGDRLLLAKDALNGEAGIFSAPVPPNQWQHEVRHWVDVMLAAVQLRVLMYASPIDLRISGGGGKDSEVSTLKYLVPVSGKKDALCSSIRIRNPSYLNFGLLGFVLVVVGCATIILINVTCVPGLAFWAAKMLGFRGGDGSSRLEWYRGHLFSLQRAVFENGGVTAWTGQESQIPVTEERGLLFRAMDRGNSTSYHDQEATTVSRVLLTHDSRKEGAVHG